MNQESTIDEISEMFNTYQKEHELFGKKNKERLIIMFLDYLNRNGIKAKQPAGKKPFKGTLIQWQKHTLSNNPERDLQSFLLGLASPQIIISGTFYNTDYHLHTSPLISFIFDGEKKEGVIETNNSIYKLGGVEGDPVTIQKDIGEIIKNIIYDK